MPPPPPTHIGVLGGGLTGLSAAFHLARRFPAAAITLLEASPRLGGWVHSERVAVHDARGNTARVLLERGPRTLRPNGRAVLELVNLLNLTPSLLTVPKSSPAAKTRFLHIPGTHGLTALPSSPLDLLRTPLGRALASAALREPFRLYADAAARADAEDEDAEDEDADEALEPFLARRLSPALARILGSALVHGIYAGDARVLSVRAAFPGLWALAAQGAGSVGRGLARRAFRRATAPDAQGQGEGEGREREYELGGVAHAMRGTSVYSFRDGMGTLTRALEDALRRANVRIVTGEGAAALARRPDGGIQVTTTAGASLALTHAVCALPLPALHALLARSPAAPPPPLPHLVGAAPLSSVAVVQLVFPPAPGAPPVHPPGFGYLVPRAADADADTDRDGDGEGDRDGDADGDGEGGLDVLGTVFDGCALGAQDAYPAADAPRFTKMTMMLRLPPSPASSLNAPSTNASTNTDASPDITQAAVLRTLAAHLARRAPLPAPALFRVHRLRACIPVPAVGHVRRMRELRAAVRAAWGARLAVVGAGVGGVSVPDCVEQGRRVGADW